MNTGRFVISQVLDLIHRQTLDRIVMRYEPKASVRHFGFRQQFICMVFTQLTSRDGLRDIAIRHGWIGTDGELPRQGDFVPIKVGKSIFGIERVHTSEKFFDKSYRVRKGNLDAKSDRQLEGLDLRIQVPCS